MAENERPSGVGPTQDGFGSLDLMRDFRTPSMSAIGSASEPVVFESFRRPEYGDRSQYNAKYGGSYTQANDLPQEMKSSEDFYVQFDVVFTGDKKVSITAGFVRNINPDAAADSPIIDWMPTLNGVPLSNDPAPEIGVEAGKVLYCEVKTDPKGLITETPTIVLGDQMATGTHYQPPQKTPVSGSLRYPIAEFESSGGELIAIQKQQGGPILVQPNLWEGRNIGGQRELYKERKNEGDFYEIRTLEQLETRGESIIKPKPPEGEEDTIKFKSIAPREGYPQINVRASGNDVVQIEGNGNYTGTEGFAASLGLADGLVSVVDDIAFGLDTTISITDGCGQYMHKMTFRKGLLDKYEYVPVAP